jgi:putative endonuclease
MTNKRFGVLYLGVTNDIARRCWEHKAGDVKGYTKLYNCNKLVWYETYENIADAIAREKQLKKWERMWKVDLIDKMNPGWVDLYEQLNC